MTNTRVIPEAQMVDIVQPYQVEIVVDRLGKTLWVNVDGVCRLRVGRILSSTIEIQDAREPEGVLPY